MKEYKCVMAKGDHKVGYPTEITGVTPVIEDYSVRWCGWVDKTVAILIS